MRLKLSDFDYELPQELIAQYPPPERAASRMLVLERKNKRILHKAFSDISSFLEKEDVVVLNDAKVVKARLLGKRRTGGKLEIFLLESMGEQKYRALVRPSDRIREGDEIFFDGSPLRARLLKKKTSDNVVSFSPRRADIERLIYELGHVPLPPYIKRSDEPVDEQRYQTVYASKEGATAAPTAGLHFTDKSLGEIRGKGTDLAFVTLHVSYGTFAPVRNEYIAEHKMHSEGFELTEETASAINRAKGRGGRVIAVGTTSCRVMETCSDGSHVEAGRGKTDLFIYPGYEFKTVDALLTNFHLPKSTLLMLVSAFAGRELILEAYKAAVAEKYRFFSYGDCMLII